MIMLRMLKWQHNSGLSVWALSEIKSILLRGRQGNFTACRQRGGVNVTTKAETGVMWSQTKECWQPVESTRGKNMSPVGASGESMTLLTP